jgi:hypothetical protein
LETFGMEIPKNCTKSHTNFLSWHSEEDCLLFSSIVALHWGLFILNSCGISTLPVGMDAC